MNSNDTQQTSCLVVGGGPAGMVLGLLLARAGVEVTVLEKHADFLRDFRGDTVHPSTLRLLDELGLGAEFDKLPRSYMEQVMFPSVHGEPLVVGDFRMLRGAYRAVAMVPQWDLLDLLAEAAKQEPTFRLRLNTEVTGLVFDGERVAGVHYTDADGNTGRMLADLTVGCDGRHSVLRSAAGFVPREYPVPVDTWWFRLSRKDDDEVQALTVQMRRGEMSIVLPRDTFHQIAYFQPKGSDAQLRGAGVAAFRARIADMFPWFADRVHELERMDEVKLLDVKLNRLRRWYAEGLLCIGDAAHAMSPIGGVGINVAVQDAVATARVLAGPLRAGRVRTADLARVQRQRWFPMVVIQTMQRAMHRALIGPVVRGERDGYPTLPRWLFGRFPRLRVLPAYLIGIGPRPERAPQWARRSPIKLGG